MVFNSITFLIFFPIVTVIYFLIPHKYRWGLLLIASYYFYMSFIPVYITLIMFSTLTTFLTALSFAKYPTRKRLFLTLCLVANFALLFVFKYLGFFAGLSQSALALMHIPYILPTFSPILPIGISFHTFQSAAYIIDTYKGKVEPETHLGYYAVFVSFFPQLIAGPIERPAALLPQLHVEHKFDYDRVVSGIRLFAWGMFKKIVVADRAAVIVNTIYNNPGSYDGSNLAIATVLFAFQIYCDFSGYTDMAIGIARVFGIELHQNFNRPYAARNLIDFWRRWHITLTTWFKDYIYIPLGGNRVPLPRWMLNTFLVFLISGLWHGAALTFIIWGALHGIVQILVHLFQKIKGKIPLLWRGAHGVGGVVSWLLTFAFVCFAWIFFRGNTISDCFLIIQKIFSPWHFSMLDVYAGNALLIISALIIVMEIAQWWLSRLKTQKTAFSALPAITRWTCYYCLLFVIFIFAQYGSQQFIYFQF